MDAQAISQRLLDGAPVAKTLAGLTAADVRHIAERLKNDYIANEYRNAARAAKRLR